LAQLNENFQEIEESQKRIIDNNNNQTCKISAQTVFDKGKYIVTFKK